MFLFKFPTNLRCDKKVGDGSKADNNLDMPYRTSCLTFASNILNFYNLSNIWTSKKFLI